MIWGLEAIDLGFVYKLVEIHNSYISILCFCFQAITGPQAKSLPEFETDCNQMEVRDII